MRIKCVYGVESKSYSQIFSPRCVPPPRSTTPSAGRVKIAICSNKSCSTTARRFTRGRLTLLESLFYSGFYADARS